MKANVCSSCEAVELNITDTDIASEPLSLQTIASTGRIFSAGELILHEKLISQIEEHQEQHQFWLSHNYERLASYHLGESRRLGRLLSQARTLEFSFVKDFSRPCNNRGGE